MTLGHKLCKNG